MSEDSTKGMSEKELFEYLDSNARLTPAERKHAKLFYHHTIYVKDMDYLTVQAHIEELAETAFVARAQRDAAVAHKNRLKAAKPLGPTGFEHSVNIDETSINAINAIKDRQKKLSKKEQIKEQLRKLNQLAGIDETDEEIEKKLLAGTILARIHRHASEVDGASPKEQSKQFINPFKKKE